MNQIKVLLMIPSLMALSACQLLGQGQKEEPVQKEIVIVKSPMERWDETRPELLAKLRTDARLRVQEIENSSIYIQIRSLSSLISKKNEISREMSSILNHILASIEGYDSIKIDIIGHTDNSGNTRRSIQISKQWAEAVSRYLHEHGAKQPINHDGFGSERPIAKNNTSEGRAVNRRVDIFLSLDETSAQPEKQTQEDMAPTGAEVTKTPTDTNKESEALPDSKVEKSL